MQAEKYSLDHKVIREITLHPVQHNRREALRGMLNFTISREHGVEIIKIEIGSETVILKIPP